jgi:guanosine-3',5'-bis(diphosphate) 3'-pyrophosphohydrolase
MIRQFELVERVKSYDPGADEDLLNRAYVFSMKAHGSQARASGDPYFSHPVGVAGILTRDEARFRLDRDRAAPRHGRGYRGDPRPDRKTCSAREIAQLVDGVTKLSRLELQSDHTKHAENFRKLVLAMSNDIRVLLVKLADRLHNMQTLHFIKSRRQAPRIAARRWRSMRRWPSASACIELKDELEDLAFAELNSDAYRSIQQRLSYPARAGRRPGAKIIAELRRR